MFSKFTISIFSLGLLLGALSCGPEAFPTSVAYKIFKPEGEPKGVVLIAHGLNLNPVIMDDLAKYLQSKNIIGVRIGLSGHVENAKIGPEWDFVPSEPNEISYEAWNAEAKMAYGLVENEKAKSKNPDLPIYLLGYSMGAAVFLDLAANSTGSEKFDFNKYILFSPPIATNFLGDLVELFFPFSSFLSLPTMCPEAYRANSSTPISAYLALFKAKDHVFEGDVNKNLNKPGVIFIDKDDELVSSSTLETILNNYELNKLNLFSVNNDGRTIDANFHHLIINKAAVGAAMWQKILNQIDTLLNLK